jgi:membrane protease subunit (stomatin/prohibitin family)
MKKTEGRKSRDTVPLAGTVLKRPLSGNLSVWKIPVFHYYGLLMRNREYIEVETLKKQSWSYLRNIKTAINNFCLQTFCSKSSQFLLSNYLAEHWDLPNTGIFYSKDVASVDQIS